MASLCIKMLLEVRLHIFSHISYLIILYFPFSGALPGDDALAGAALEESLALLVLNGRTGCGKSVLLLQAAEYAAASSAWLVLYIPAPATSSTPAPRHFMYCKAQGPLHPPESLGDPVIGRIPTPPRPIRHSNPFCGRLSPSIDSRHPHDEKPLPPPLCVLTRALSRPRLCIHIRLRRTDTEKINEYCAQMEPARLGPGVGFGAQARIQSGVRRRPRVGSRGVCVSRGSVRAEFGPTPSGYTPVIVLGLAVARRLHACVHASCTSTAVGARRVGMAGE
ncbi:hypothetical protein B0H11DRAFT_1932716 [Mycena galericulata]|nr:hypothetical protein B0H11DRAFT_1932716 [Mycena galericulata]